MKIMIDVTEWARKVYPISNYKYCWSCGAKMDGDENG